MAKKLYRSKKDRKIAGVCGGIAEYFNIDPIIIRLLTLILVLSVGAGLIAYIIAWIFIPEEPDNLYPVAVNN
ncbi:MAG: PspC domain-containing protein [Methanotrichaceae archaeon]|nr:PspC domain-containing protein [Methanotrichaceae archaeon]